MQLSVETMNSNPVLTEYKPTSTVLTRRAGKKLFHSWETISTHAVSVNNNNIRFGGTESSCNGRTAVYPTSGQPTRKASFFVHSRRDSDVAVTGARYNQVGPTRVTQPPPPRHAIVETMSGLRLTSRIRINVSGQHFDTWLEVLDRHPNTLLGNPVKRRRFYDSKNDEYFLDRHRPSFEAIFAYYMYGGKVKRPPHVPDEIFLAELLFHELEPSVVEQYKFSEGYTTEEHRMPTNQFLQKLWNLFEHPETSFGAVIVAIISVAMILIAILLFCLETLPRFFDTSCLPNSTAPNWYDPFFVVESICTGWFTIEFLVRFIACPSLIAFSKDFKNAIDLVAILPYYVTLVNMLWADTCDSAKSSTVLSFLRVIRLIRVFKLTKHSVGLQVLILTFRASVEGLCMFLVALTVSVLIYSSALYYAELSVPGSEIESIPDGFWWAVITMTTVGYGDKVPKGNMGKIVGSACAISGILTLAIPVPIIAGHFNRFYTHKTRRNKVHAPTIN